METIIEARGLGKRFRQKDAVKDLHLSLPAGRASAFLGRNGAGKTTTIKMLAGLIRPSSGSSSLFGQDSQQLRPERSGGKTGYVSENQELYDWMTGEQLIAFTSALYPNWDRGLRERVVRETRHPAPAPHLPLLAAGEKVKLALLLAMAFRPRLLILDEPFAGLDPLVRFEFLDTLLEITRQNDWSIFFSTHDIDDVEKARRRRGDHRRRTAPGLRITRCPARSDSAASISTDRPSRLGKALQSSDSNARAITAVSFIPPSNGETVATLQASHPQARIEVSTLSLKEIFIALAKKFQTENPRS
jgi:ABC-2 type transport system ATP-binding protein